jgi:hypothetical protein
VRNVPTGGAERRTAGLEVKCRWYDQDVLEISLSASNTAFSGIAFPYVSLDHLVESALNLDGFPKNTTDARELRFGTPGEDFAGGFVRLKFSCRDLSGHGVVEVEIESKNESQPGSSWTQASQTVHFFAAVESNAIDDFVKELRRLGENRSGAAWLAFSST